MPVFYRLTFFCNVNFHIFAMKKYTHKNEKKIFTSFRDWKANTLQNF